MPPKPRKQLDSRRIQNSLRANILSLIKHNYRAVACRATWRVQDEDLELARLQIASKRLLLNDAISAINGVLFFFSSISSVCSNPTSAKEHQNRNQHPKAANEENEVYPCVAFFIVYKPSEQCDDDTFFSALHHQDVEPVITPIKVKRGQNEDMEAAAKQLFQTLKDHNNVTMQELVDVSNVYCYRNASESSSENDDEDEDEEEFHPKRFPTVPCCFVIVNHDGYLDALDAAITELQSDGLVVETTLNDYDPVPSLSQANNVTSTIRKVGRIMQLSNHALHCGMIYARPTGARMTYVKLMDVSSYLNKLLLNEAINEDLMKQLHVVERILSHSACEIIEQLQFDLNLIEVMNGLCFSISQRAFIEDAIVESQLGKLSPRAYIPYDSSKPPQPRYFSEGVVNSFRDEEVRLNFLNKFYQCLLAGRMPHKTRKLVVAGPRDSGKTSWANIFHRIIPPEYIASVTNERQFSAAMITELTQLVIIDEWSGDTMNSDLAKTILQGGWMVTAVKHGQPRCVHSNSPFYITTNNVPDYGDENENVERRIKIFNTLSLPRTIPGIDRWIYDNAMHCITWIANEISSHRTLIDAEELWYEEQNTIGAVVSTKSSEVEWKRNEIMQITQADLDGPSPNVRPAGNTTIHSGFVAEFRSRRLMRKRRRRRQLQINSSSEDDQETNIPDFESEIGQSQDNDGEEMILPLPDNSLPSQSAISYSHLRPQNVEENAEYDPDDITSYVPEGGWTLNNDDYFDKVANMIENRFYTEIQKGHVHSFSERRRLAALRRTREEIEFWTKPDPEIDAWMLATGNSREIFDVKSFVERHANILKPLEDLRTSLNVRVMPDHCPVQKALNEDAEEEEGEEQEEGRERQQLSSQTFWTTVKNWFGK